MEKPLKWEYVEIAELGGGCWYNTYFIIHLDKIGFSTPYWTVTTRSGTSPNSGMHGLEGGSKICESIQEAFAYAQDWHDKNQTVNFSNFWLESQDMIEKSKSKRKMKYD